MARYGMLIDLDKCTGCRSCMEACKVENNTPQGVLWMYVFRFEEGKYPNTRLLPLPRPCMHCDNAPCAKVCPVGARYKREDGLVATDWKRSIGCRYCMVSCPYGVNYANWKDPKKNLYMDWENKDLKPVTNGAAPAYKNPDLDMPYGKEQRYIAGGAHSKGVMGKCTFCVQRVEKDLLPACVAVCPVVAIYFGDLDDPSSNVSKLLREKPSFRLLEDLDTKPRVHYLGGHPPKTESRQIEEVKVRV